MIRVSVMANDSLVVDEIASLITQEIALDILQLTYCLSRNMHEYILNPDSVLITIDDGEASLTSRPESYPAQSDGPLLLVNVSLKAINLDICQGYQLNQLQREQVTTLVRDFSRNYLRQIDEAAPTWAI